MPLKYQPYIYRRNLRDNPTWLYVFGDNLIQQGFGGQAREMRGEPNAVGIPTKWSPGRYLEDSDFWSVLEVYVTRFKKLHDHLYEGGTIVWPADGIGTGLAQLETKSPLCWSLLTVFTTALFNADNTTHK